MKNVFDGILCLPVTPFKKDEVDTDTLRKIIDVIIEDGADGLVPTGATGEFPYLLHDERKKTWETVVDETNGRAKVIAGTGAISTKEAIQFTKEAKDIGCDGVMLAHPMLMPATDAETYEHFKAVATKVDIPIIMYNNPGFGKTMSPSVVARLAEEYSNIVSYKEDDFFHLRFAEIIRRCRDKITLFTGSPAAYLSFLTHGGHGALIAEFQAFPHLVNGLRDSFAKCDHEKALYYHEMILKMFNIIDTYFVGASFWGRYKAIWRLRGVDMSFEVRAPCTPVKPEQLEKAKPEFMKLEIDEDWFVR
ncbi:MAG: dihydrodipicolinate synthase family protein [Candidatus Bathyarchaeota archaeon]